MTDARTTLQQIEILVSALREQILKDSLPLKGVGAELPRELRVPVSAAKQLSRRLNEIRQLCAIALKSQG